MEKKIPTNTITRDIKDLAAPTGNIYETVVILSKRANQISLAEKKELAKKLDEGRAELFNLRFQMATSQLDNTARVNTVKKDIARVLTEQRAREIAAEKSAVAE